jgi:hypothetical protein
MPPFKSEGTTTESFFGRRGNRGSWAFFLLPFVEQESLFNDSAFPGPDGTAYDYNVTLPTPTGNGGLSAPNPPTAPPTPGQMGFAGQQRLRIFQCPSDPTYPGNGLVSADPNNYGSLQGYGACSYAANYLVFGCLLPSPFDTAGSPYAASILNPDGYDPTAQPTSAGANLPKIPSSFKDGMSNTILFGEKFASECYWYAAGSLSDGLPAGNLWAPSVESAQWAPAFAMESPWADGLRFQVNPNSVECESAYPQTGHVGGMAAALADGSCKNISPKIENSVWIALCTANGGETVALDY